MERFHHSYFAERVGSTGNDTFRLGSHQIFYGLDGADTMSAYSGSGYTFMVGGKGNDTYIAANNTAITIFDSGGQDTVVATGLGINYSSTYVGTIEGKHLIAADVVSGQQIVVANWLVPENRIETIKLGTGTYTFTDLANYIPTAPNFLGDLSVSSLVSLGILPGGTRPSDLQDMLNHVVAREAELTQLAHEAETPLPLPPPVPAPTPTFHVPGFDAGYYLANNSDVASNGIDPATHFALYGWQEGRDPNAWFDTSWYLEQYRDVAAANINPITHFSLYGWQEGRDPNAWFDTSWYLEQYRDVAAANINPITHFSLYGWHEGRDPNALFDTNWYLEQYRDVAAAGINPVEHYWLYGWQEGRDPSPLFDSSAYLDANPDVQRAGVNPLEHWILYGEMDGGT